MFKTAHSPLLSLLRALNRSARRYALTGLIGCCLAPLSGCGANAREDAVTETGNPSHIDKSRLKVTFMDDQIVVRGTAGATPGQAKVALTNTSNDNSNSGTSAANGAFKLEVTGEPGDSLTLEVKVDGVTSSVKLSVDAAEDAGAASCSELERSITKQKQAIADADRTCEGDSDCVAVWSGDCVLTCETQLLSNQGREEVGDILDNATEAVCAPYFEQTCTTAQPGCGALLGGVSRRASCVSGQCEWVEEEPSCQPALDASQALDALLNREDPERCSSDFDCHVVSNNFCVTTCTTEAIPTSALAEYEELRATAEGACESWSDETCQSPISGCTEQERFPNGPACVDGRCGEYPLSGLTSCFSMGVNCAEDEYCAYRGEGECGKGDILAACRPRPTECPEADEPVCGCDGMTHSSPCEAALNGVGYGAEGPCEN